MLRECAKSVSAHLTFHPALSCQLINLLWVFCRIFLQFFHVAKSLSGKILFWFSLKLPRHLQALLTTKKTKLFFSMLKIKPALANTFREHQLSWEKKTTWSEKRWLTGQAFVVKVCRRGAHADGGETSGDERRRGTLWESSGDAADHLLTSSAREVTWCRAPLRPNTHPALPPPLPLSRESGEPPGWGEKPVCVCNKPAGWPMRREVGGAGKQEGSGKSRKGGILCNGVEKTIETQTHAFVISVLMHQRPLDPPARILLSSLPSLSSPLCLIYRSHVMSTHPAGATWNVPLKRSSLADPFMSWRPFLIMSNWNICRQWYKKVFRWLLFDFGTIYTRRKI